MQPLGLKFSHASFTFAKEVVKNMSMPEIRETLHIIELEFVKDGSIEGFKALNAMFLPQLRITVGQFVSAYCLQYTLVRSCGV